MIHDSELQGVPEEPTARSQTQFTQEDEGKSIVTADGTVLGRISMVRDAEAYVKPKPGLLISCGSWANASWSEEDGRRLHSDMVADVTDTAVVVNVAVEGRSPFPN